MPRIELYVNYEHQATVTLDSPSVSIGRDPSCAIHLTDDRVSRIHAMLHADGDGHVLEDQSTNGTKVNGVSVTGRQVLRPGDAIFIAKYTLMYQADGVSQGDLDATMIPDWA
jgi:type VI secretion system protein ImpI